ncbi:MAG: zinc-ribbon domain-containing protein [Coprococcus sp.]
MEHNKITYEQKHMVSDFPKLMKFWDEKENIRNPDELSAKSDINVYWHCKECGFDWETSPKARLKASDKCPCHELNRYRKKGVNDFFTIFPDGKLSYDFEANKNIEIYTLGLKDTETKIAWCCEVCGYKWYSPLGYRISFKKEGFRLKKCKKCSGVSQRTKVTSSPEMIAFWDYEKNNEIGLNPDELSIYSDVYANWECPKCGYLFYTQINSRHARKDACPCCSSNLGVSKGYNDVVTLTKGEILYYFNPKNNQGIDLNEYGCSEKIVSVNWNCPDCGFQWSTLVKSRVYSKNGIWKVKKCPACNGQRRLNSYSVDYPILNEMFDEEKNGRKFSDLTGCRDDVRGKYWWKCLKCDHSFESILNSMISSYKNPAKGCPYCSKFKITYENSFAYVCKEYMDEYSSNNEIDPTTVFPSNNTSVEWVCRMNPEHVWNATFRTRYARNGDCPACNNRRPVSGQNTFLAHYPELAKMQSQNKKCDLDNIFFDSKQWDRWICPSCLGEFGAYTTEMVDGTWACPYCENRRVLPNYNSFNVTQKDIMDNEYDYIANYNLIPYDSFGEKCRIRLWWHCANGHRYTMSPSDKIYFKRRNKETCPYCKGLRRKKRHFV